MNVDVDGNVSLRGSENVRILINGKPSGLAGMSSTDALRQLSGDLIEKVEIITNPSARYDAEGEVGIINLILKKESRKGFNGTININTGYPDNHGASLHLNWRRKNINVFSSIGLRYREAPGTGSTFQEFYQADSIRFLNSDRTHSRGGLSYSNRIGMDYSIFKTHYHNHIWPLPASRKQQYR